MPNEWIDVKDRLPEMAQDVLVLTNKGKCFNGWKEFYPLEWEARKRPWFSEFFIDTLDDEAGIVTHWMPLPEKPKQELFEYRDRKIRLKGMSHSLYINPRGMFSPHPLVEWLNDLPLKLDESKLNECN